MGKLTEAKTIVQFKKKKKKRDILYKDFALKYNPCVQV